MLGFINPRHTIIKKLLPWKVCKNCSVPYYFIKTGSKMQINHFRAKEAQENNFWWYVRDFRTKTHFWKKKKELSNFLKFAEISVLFENLKVDRSLPHNSIDWDSKYDLVPKYTYSIVFWASINYKNNWEKHTPKNSIFFLGGGRKGVVICSDISWLNNGK
jgi:hypothetical protein